MLEQRKRKNCCEYKVWYLLYQIALALEFAVIMIVMKDISKEFDKNTLLNCLKLENTNWLFLKHEFILICNML